MAPAPRDATAMRFVVFTADPELEQSPFWPAIVNTPGLRHLLVLRCVSPAAQLAPWRRLMRNVRRRGWLYIPYRLVEEVRHRLGSRLVPGAGIPESLAVSHLTVSDLRSADVLQALRDFAPDLGVSCGAPILPDAAFSIPRMGTINIHCGRLPAYRGMPPAFWELWTGAAEVGATVHWVDAGLDTGAIIDEASAPLYPERDTIAEADRRARELGALVLRRVLHSCGSGVPAGRPQPEGGHTYRTPTTGQLLRLSLRLAASRWRRRLLSPRWLLRTMATAASLWIWRPLRDGYRTLTRTHPVRVFTFHRVTSLVRDGMTVTPERFGEQIAYIATHHRVVPLATALDALCSRTRLARPLAVVTFDDAYRSVYDNGAPILFRSEVPATVFVATGVVGANARFPHDAHVAVREFLDVMEWTECRELVSRGWSIGGHTHLHARASDCTDSQWLTELDLSTAVLDREALWSCRAFAFPFGQPSDLTAHAVRAVQEQRYDVAFGDFGGENPPGADLRLLRRIDVGGDHDPLAWRALVHAVDPGSLWRLRRWATALRGLLTAHDPRNVMATAHSTET